MSDTRASLPWLTAAGDGGRPVPARRGTVRRGVDVLVAAAERLTGTRIRERRDSEGWQSEAWDAYEQVGELRFVVNSEADTVGQVTTFPARYVEGFDDPERVTDGIAAEVFALLGGDDRRQQIIRDLALQVAVAGAGYLVGMPPDEDGRGGAGGLPPTGEVTLADLTWHVRSVEDVIYRSRAVRVRMPDGTDRDLDPDDGWLVKVYRPHPRRVDQADSAVRSVLPILREIIGLTKHVSAQVDSRLAGAGLLLLPDSVRVQAQSPDPDDGTDGQDDDFLGALIESMVTPIRDRDVASAVVPMVATVPDDSVDKVRHVTFATPLDESAVQLRAEAIRRLALGLDEPPEVLLGMTQANHWSAWQVEESRVKTRIVPLVEMICRALTEHVFRPALEAAGVPDPDTYVLAADATTLLLRPNRAADAQALHDRGEISGEALRREAGFDESDAPEVQTDRAVEIALRLVQDSPGLIVDPGLPAVVETIREQVGGAGGAGGAAGTAPEVAPTGTDEPQEG